jgi:hypothetical protein
MNRIPLSLDLSPLVGLEIIQVSIGQNEVILVFHPAGFIRLEGDWILKENDGRIIDQSMEHSERDAWRIHKIIGSKISECIIRDERHLDILFDGYILEIEDDSDHYETFAIEHPLIKLYV